MEASHIIKPKLAESVEMSWSGHSVWIWGRIEGDDIGLHQSPYFTSDEKAVAYHNAMFSKAREAYDYE